MIFYRKIVSSLAFKTLEKFGNKLRKSTKYRAIVSYFDSLLGQPKSRLEMMNRMQKFGIRGGCLFMFGIVFRFLLFPKILKFAVHTQVSLKPGTDVRELWSKIPFALDFKIYLFNVTNADEIKAGAKPILRQVGPYFFDEWHEKDKLVDDPKEDTIEYAMKNTYYFRPEKSGGLTGEEELVLPHIFMLAVVMAAAREKPTAMPIINKAINSIFKNPDNIFVKVKAMDLMFRGLPIDCSVTDTPATAVCSVVREKSDQFIVVDKNHFGFALFGPSNGTVAKERFKSLRGKKKQNDIGRVVEYDGKKNISKWNDEYCDTFNGTDGYVFHPYLYEDEDIVAFAPPLCRSLSLYYERKTKVKGIKTNRYTAWLGDPNTIPEQKCYCPEKGCLKAGVMDLHKCLGVPLVASHPHFYRADPYYLTLVDGLNPNAEDHGIEIDFDPLAGSPIAGKKRLQLNMMIFPVEKIKIMKTFPEALLPLVWIEESFVLPKDLIFQVKLLHRARAVVRFMCYMMILGGLGMAGYSGYLLYKEKHVKNLKPVKPTNAASKTENDGNTNTQTNGNDRAAFKSISVSPGQVPAPIN